MTCKDPDLIICKMVSLSQRETIFLDLRSLWFTVAFQDQIQVAVICTLNLARPQQLSPPLQYYMASLSANGFGCTFAVTLMLVVVRGSKDTASWTDHFRWLQKKDLKSWEILISQPKRTKFLSNEIYNRPGVAGAVL